MNKIYYKAAKRVTDWYILGNSPYCCDNLDTDREALKWFKLMFEPIPYLAFWWGIDRSPENQMARSIALLLMEEMEKDI